MMDIERASRKLTFCSTIKHPFDREDFGASLVDTNISVLCRLPLFLTVSVAVSVICTTSRNCTFFTEYVYEFSVVFRTLLIAFLNDVKVALCSENREYFL
jgi:hypothetical protein